MTLTDLLTILAILLAPIVAVQVQKRLELFREESGRKLRIFKTLMATRGATISPEHVQALNMIDLEFQGKQYRNVTNAWKNYLDHLNSYPKDDEQLQMLWNDKRSDFLTSLLIEMGNSLGYEFDAVHVKKAFYIPEAHDQIEKENILIRRGLVTLLFGDNALKMEVTKLPISEQVRAEQEELNTAVRELLDGKRSLSVALSDERKKKETS